MTEGAKTVKIHGDDFKIKARIENLAGASAHADYEELLTWLKTLKNRPNKVFITHGEEEAAASLHDKIREEFGWDVYIPEYLQTESL